MVSKELLSEVLKDDFEGFIREFREDKHSIRINPMYQFNDREMIEYGCEANINIHELAHKCKEWVSSKEYKMDSGTNCLIGYSASTCRSMTDDEWTVFQADTEPEAIFKATQWVYDNKE